MPRNMSFFFTTKQVREKTKTVTRRLGWWFLKPGDIINAVEKCQGLKKGEKVKKICQIRIIQTRRGQLDFITPLECIREGFPLMGSKEFIEMFCKVNKCDSSTIINRIWFEYI